MNLNLKIILSVNKLWAHYILTLGDIHSETKIKRQLTWRKYSSRKQFSWTGCTTHKAQSYRHSSFRIHHRKFIIKAFEFFSIKFFLKSLMSLLYIKFCSVIKPLSAEFRKTSFIFTLIITLMWQNFSILQIFLKKLSSVKY
jgi:hypothetical protein